MSDERVISMYQPMLVSIAYKMVNNLMDAEDIVQDTLLKFLSSNHQHVQNLKAYLIKAVTNNCINHLKKLKQNAEELIDPLLHAEWMGSFDFDLHKIDLDAELSAALKVLMQKLEPSERAVFLFREVFSFDYAEIAEIVEKKKDNCRQLFCRAQSKLQEEKTRFNLNLDHHRQTFNSFVESCREGSFKNLVDSLKSDIAEKLQK
jgi:RNA polymerase sigma factor (sigma-70 family)